MTASDPLRMTVEEYLAFDAAAPEGMRYEYWNGVVVPVHGYDETGTVAMAGASPEHNQITGNLAATLHGSMTARGCRGALGRQRVRVTAACHAYPDVAFACGRPIYSGDVPPTLVNPTLVVEIVSASTAGQDWNRKMSAYTQIESLAEYWIIETTRPEVTRVVRQADGWGLRFHRGLGATLASDALGVEVSVAEVYRLVNLPASDEGE